MSSVVGGVHREIFGSLDENNLGFSMRGGGGCAVMLEPISHRRIARPTPDGEARLNEARMMNEETRERPTVFPLCRHFSCRLTHTHSLPFSLMLYFAFAVGGFSPFDQDPAGEGMSSSVILSPQSE